MDIKNKNKIIKLSAIWCQPCKQMKVIFDNIRKDFPNLEYQDIDIDDYPEFSKMYKVKSIPTIIIFDNNGEEYRIEGLHSEKHIKDSIIEIFFSS